MLTPSSEASKNRAAEMRLIAESKEMQNLLQMRLPNKGEHFSEISRKGLVSVRQDKGIFKSGLK